MENVSSKILTKLGKIKAHYESAKAIGSEAEAQHFARMLDELLLKHKLEMTDIEYDSEVKDEPVDQYPVGGGGKYDKERRKYHMADYPDIEIGSRRNEWSERLGRIVCDAYSCRMLVTTGSDQLWFVGRKSNVAIAEYTYIVMRRTIESLSWKEYKTARNKTKWEYIKNFPKHEQAEAAKEVDYFHLTGYRSSWIRGFLDRLNQLFEDDRTKAQAEGSGTALMRLNKDKEAVAQYMKSLHTSSAHRIGGNGRGFNSTGYAAGKEAADRATRNKGVGTSGGSKQLN